MHIQASQEIPPAKLMPGDSSSSTFHEFEEFLIFNYQKSAIRNLKKHKWTPKVSEITKFLSF